MICASGHGLALALPPNTENVLGEGTNGGIGDPGRPQRLLPLAGLRSNVPLGLYKEEAASCRFTNVQSPGDRRSCLSRVDSMDDSDGLMAKYRQECLYPPLACNSLANL